jgi:hypothetical protein
MPALLQICIVIVTIGLLVIALMTVRMMSRFFERATGDISQLTAVVRESVAQIDLVTHSWPRSGSVSRLSGASWAASKPSVCVPPSSRPSFWTSWKCQS